MASLGKVSEQLVRLSSVPEDNQPSHDEDSARLYIPASITDVWALLDGDGQCKLDKPSYVTPLMVV